MLITATPPIKQFLCYRTWKNERQSPYLQRINLEREDVRNAAKYFVKSNVLTILVAH